MRAATLVSAFLLVAAAPAGAAIITFDDAIVGSTSYNFDGDGDGVSDAVFTTSDVLGFRTAGPGPNQNYVQEPGLEGSTLLNPDLRVDFIFGASESLSFGFALNSFNESSSYAANFQVFDAANNLLGSGTTVGLYGSSPLGFGETLFPEGLVTVAFSGIAAYGLFDFTSEYGRYLIDNFEGTFGSTEPTGVPEPGTLALALGGFVLIAGFGVRRRRRAA